MTDRELAEGYVNGSPTAEKEIRGWLKGFVPSKFYSDNVLTPDDIISDTMIELLECLRNKTFSYKSSLKTFSFSIARHIIGNIIRRRTIEHRYLQELSENPDQEEDIIDLMDNKGKVETFLGLLEQADEKCREIWNLIFVKRLKHKEIGEMLHMSTGAVKTKVSRCKDDLEELSHGYV